MVTVTSQEPLFGQNAVSSTHVRERPTPNLEKSLKLILKIRWPENCFELHFIENSRFFLSKMTLYNIQIPP
jgi:hypothetical protein